MKEYQTQVPPLVELVAACTECDWYCTGEEPHVESVREAAEDHQRIRGHRTEYGDGPGIKARVRERDRHG